MTDIDWTKPIQTTCGKPARLLADDVSYGGIKYKLIAVNYDGNEIVHFPYAVPPKFIAHGMGAVTIINAPERVQGWLNIYPSGEQRSGSPYKTKDYADGMAISARIACIYIDVPVGEGLTDD